MSESRDLSNFSNVTWLATWHEFSGLSTLNCGHGVDFCGLARGEVLTQKVETGRRHGTFMTKVNDVKDDFTSVKLPTEFVDWLRAESEKQGKFMYRLVVDHVASHLKERPWERRKK